MKPRRLRVLIIDDDLPLSKEIDETVPRSHVPPDTIKVFGTIPSWKSALQFWLSYKDNAGPDLVVADVRFEKDATSPLQTILAKSGNRLPTGLSHLKPLVALARATGHIVGVGIYTKWPDCWESMVQPERSLPDQIMGRLAAHEIGEIAAILGDDCLADPSAEDSLHPYWEWLRQNTGNEFKIALGIALCNYRRRLLALAAFPPDKNSSVLMMPDDYVAVMDWCARMEANPQPLDDRNDYGLTLTYRDGGQVCISLASIFSDVEDITTRPMEKSCFQRSSEMPSPSKEPFKLNDNGKPRIGEFLERFDTLNVIYEKAARYVYSFPDSPGVKPDVRLPDFTEEILVRGFIAVFQLLRLEKVRIDRWDDLCRNHVFDPSKGEFTDINEVESAYSLSQRLTQVIGVIRSLQNTLGVESFHPDEVFNKDSPIEWIRDVSAKDKAKGRWYLERLEDARILKHAPNGEYTLISKGRYVDALPIPPTLPNGKTVDSYLDLPSIKEWLKQSLGFEGDAHGLNRLFYFAFVQRGADTPGEKSRAGGEFLNQLLAGKGPTWLLKMLERFAENDLQWHDKKTWPSWLR